MTTTTHAEPVAYPFNDAEGLDKAYAAARESAGMVRVKLPFGEPARLPGLRIAGDIEWKTQMIMCCPRVMPVGW